MRIIKTVVIATIFRGTCRRCGDIKESSNVVVIENWARIHSCEDRAYYQMDSKDYHA